MSVALQSARLALVTAPPMTHGITVFGLWGAAVGGGGEEQEAGEHRTHSLALFVQKVEQCRGLLADEVDAAGVVDVVDIVPADAFRPVLLLNGVEGG